MFTNSDNQKELSHMDIEQLQKLIRLYKKYYNSKDMTMLDAIVAKSEEEFKNAYPEISLKRSNKINPLTGCAHGTKASTILAAIIFTEGQLLPKNGVRNTRAFKMKPRKDLWPRGNENFVSAIHFNSVNTRNSIKRFDHSFRVLIEFAELDHGVVFDNNVFVEKIKKRCKDEGIREEWANLDDNITQIFQLLSSIPVITLGDGVGKFEGNIENIVAGQPDEILYERFNIRIIVVKKEHIPLVSFLAKLCPELNIKIVEQEKFCQFTNVYDCKNDGPFIEAVVKHFKLQLPFSEKAEHVTLEKRSIYNGTMHDQSHYDDLPEWVHGIVGCLDKVSYYTKNPITQRQNFYGEERVKSAIENSEVIDGYDPIEYALLHRVLLNKKSSIIYAMENRVKINNIDPTIWAEVNKYRIEIISSTNENCEREERYVKPIDYAIEHNILIENKDAKVWRDTVGKERIGDEKEKRKEKLRLVAQSQQKPVLTKKSPASSVNPPQGQVVQRQSADEEINDQPTLSPQITPQNKSNVYDNKGFGIKKIMGVVGAIAGAIIGATIAYLAGATTLPIIAAIAVISAVPGVLIGYGIAEICEKVSGERKNDPEKGILTALSIVLTPEWLNGNVATKT